MALSKQNLFDWLDKATDMMVAAAPLVQAFGVPFASRVAGLANSAVDIVQDTLAQADEAKIVLTSEDKVLVEDKLAKLTAEADRLSDIIAAS